MRRGAIVKGVWSADGSVQTPTKFPNQLDLSHKYALYVTQTCPWAHSTAIAKKLKNVENVQLVYTSPYRGPEGWTFSDDFKDPFYHKQHLHQVYTNAEPEYSGASSVPLLVDLTTGKIASNDSEDIIRIFNEHYRSIGYDLWPVERNKEIEEGLEALAAAPSFYGILTAKSEEDKENAGKASFEYLRSLDARFSKQRFYLGDKPTILDIRLFQNIIRFALASGSHHKLDIASLPHLWGFIRDFYNLPHVAETIDLPVHIDAGIKNWNLLQGSKLAVPPVPQLDLSPPNRVNVY